MGTEGGHIANRVHWHFDEAGRIDERLRRGLRLQDVGIDRVAWLFRLLTAGMRWIERTDPGEALLQQHLLEVVASLEAIVEAARCAEAVGRDAAAFLEGGCGSGDV